MSLTSFHFKIPILSLVICAKIRKLIFLSLVSLCEWSYKTQWLKKNTVMISRLSKYYDKYKYDAFSTIVTLLSFILHISVYYNCIYHDYTYENFV